jgi:hypothetical protein
MLTRSAFLIVLAQFLECGDHHFPASRRPNELGATEWAHQSLRVTRTAGHCTVAVDMDIARRNDVVKMIVKTQARQTSARKFNDQDSGRDTLRIRTERRYRTTWHSACRGGSQAASTLSIANQLQTVATPATAERIQTKPPHRRSRQTSYPR